MELAGAEFNETEGENLALAFNPAHADKLFAGSGHNFQELAELAKERKPLPHFPLTVSIQAKAKVKKKAVESANIVARLPGNDPQLKNEYVVLSAHIDHVGIGEPVRGDRIYNGAWTTRPASAVLLECGSGTRLSISCIRHHEPARRSPRDRCAPTELRIHFSAADRFPAAAQQYLPILPPFFSLWPSPGWKRSAENGAMVCALSPTRQAPGSCGPNRQTICPRARD